MRYHWRQSAAKKERGTAHMKQKSRTISGRFTSLLLNLANLEDLFGVVRKYQS